MTQFCPDPPPKCEISHFFFFFEWDLPLANLLFYLQVHLILARSSDDLASHHSFVLFVDPLRSFFLLVISFSSLENESSSYGELRSLKLICQVLPRRIVKNFKLKSKETTSSIQPNAAGRNSAFVNVILFYDICLICFCLLPLDAVEFPETLSTMLAKKFMSMCFWGWTLSLPKSRMMSRRCIYFF